MLIMVGKELM